jgi:hypothetical protein
MEITAYLQEIGISINEQGLVATLEQVAGSVMAAVKVNGIGGIEPLHEFLEVGRGSHQNQVKMILHQDIAMHLYSEEIGGSFQDFQKPALVSVIGKDRSSLITS